MTIEFADDEGRASFLTHEPAWTPTAAEWEQIKRRSLEQPARVAVLGVNQAAPRKILSGARITISTSKDEVGAPIFYREVNLPFIEAVTDPSRIRWRFGSISSAEQPPIVLDNLPVCGNCHSFSADGRMLGMDVDYANDKGSYAFTPVKEEIVLAPREIITWSDYQRVDGEYTFGLLSQVSPDGRYAVSTVRDRSVFVATPELAFSQLFFPIQGILAVYSRETGEFSALPGADDPEYVQSNPTWSPDGKYVVFARSKAYQLRRDEGNVLLTKEECEEFLEEGKQFLFDLYRVPFNDGQGGEAEPLEGASNNGVSNYFAKYSPDGKWIVFCKAKSYMLLQPDSELYIMPAEGGEPRRLRGNTPRMNSWHSWSPNGKWLVFSSKANTAYTQLFLTHIDDEGNSSPPVLLERFTARDRAANIPEFVNVETTALTRIREAFLDDVSFVRAGDAFLFRGGDVRSAIREYRKALELNPKNAVAHSNLGGLLVNEGMAMEGALHLSEAMRLDPENYSAHYNLGRLLFRQGRIDEAIEHYSAALEIKPDLADAHSTLGALLCTQRKFEEGAFHLTEAIRLDPEDASARCSLGELLMREGQLAEAAVQFLLAVQLAPRDSTARYCLGEVLARQGKTDEAIQQLSLAVQIEPGYASAHYSLGKAMVRQGQLDEGLRHLSAAARMKPNDADVLKDLAHALALAGEFPDAVSIAERVLQLAEAAGKGSFLTRSSKASRLPRPRNSCQGGGDQGADRAVQSGPARAVRGLPVAAYRMSDHSREYMKDRQNVPVHRVLPGMHVVTLTRPAHTEVCIMAVPVEGRSPQTMLREIAGVLRDGGARIVSLDVFGLGGQGTGGEGMLSEAFDSVSWPVTWLEAERGAGQEVGGVQVWAVSGAAVEPLELDGRIVGSVFEAGGARYCRLGGLLPTDVSRPRATQARDVLERMEAALDGAGLGFGDVLRTWFFNDEILSWYAEFNQVRDAFFKQRGVYDGVVPASTGIGGRNTAGAALLGGLLAVGEGSSPPRRPCHTRVAAVPSPLQCPALEYGSSFNRAVELVTPDCRQLLVSGTASLAPDGGTAHVGDVAGQIARTMDVVQAILESREMSWADVTRGVAYFKRAEDAPAFRRCCADKRMEPLPVVCAQSTVCRDELLFELEVDAAVTT